MVGLSPPYAAALIRPTGTFSGERWPQGAKGERGWGEERFVGSGEPQANRIGAAMGGWRWWA